MLHDRRDHWKPFLARSHLCHVTPEVSPPNVPLSVTRSFFSLSRQNSFGHAVLLQPFSAELPLSAVLGGRFSRARHGESLSLSAMYTHFGHAGWISLSQPCSVIILGRTLSLSCTRRTSQSCSYSFFGHAGWIFPSQPGSLELSVMLSAFR